MPLIRHNQRMLEAMMTPPEAAAYAEEWCAVKSGRRFARRWRLEGTKVGNSHLVTRAKGLELRGAYGGELVELVPPPARRFTLKERAAADKLPFCPVCAAERGKPCRARKGGGIRQPHKKRMEFHGIVTAFGEQAIQTCEFCNQKAFEPKKHGIGKCYEPEEIP